VLRSPGKEFCNFYIRSLAPQQAAGNALAVAGSKGRRKVQVKARDLLCYLAVRNLARISHEEFILIIKTARNWFNNRWLSTILTTLT
jgi:hypothetical protein